MSDTDERGGPRYGRVLDAIREEVGGLYEAMPGLPVARAFDPEEIRTHLRDRFTFREAEEPDVLISEVGDMLRRWSVQVTHPRYFGLFNPTPRPVTLAADALTAAFNPQLAVWDHSPAGNEIEAHVLRFLTDAVGFDLESSHASFTSGGQEANHTAVIAALASAFPRITEEGLRCLPGDPRLYVSRQGHHSIEKAASATGLGHGAVRRVDVDAELRMDPDDLRRRIRRDREAGHVPFLVVATAGTTGAGAVDPLDRLGAIARNEGLWLHVDAAWAGSALLSRNLRGDLEGVEEADSLTWDAHKWLWAPVATGMFFCRHPEAVARPFSLRADYVPPGTPGTSDRLGSTLQWSRRFIGLRVFMTLAELGASGVERLVDRQVSIGDHIRRRLRDAGWEVVNASRLPLICFTHPEIRGGSVDAREVAKRVCTGGQAWISSLTLPGHGQVLRACVTSYRTDEGDVEVLIEALERALSVRRRPRRTTDG